VNWATPTTPPWDSLSRWPLYLQADDFLVVHAGLDPRVPSVNLQSPRDLLSIRIPEEWIFPGRGVQARSDRRLRSLGAVGAADPSACDRARHRCVYGGSLTALALPERRLISVPAEKAYQERD